MGTLSNNIDEKKKKKWVGNYYCLSKKKKINWINSTFEIS